jgi:hypothetical protein
MARDIWSSHFNTETLKGAEEWLKGISNAMAGQSKYLQAWGEMGSWIRVGTIGSAINMNLGTAMKHLPSALTFSVARAGFFPTMKSYFDLYGNPWSAFINHKFITENSGEIAKRGTHFQRVTGHEAIRFKGRGVVFGRSVLDMIATIEGSMVRFADAFSTRSTWWTIFKDQYRLHGDKEQAIRAADAAVRYTHGSSDITGKPPLAASKNPAIRFIVNEYMNYQTTLNAFFQQAYEGAARARDLSTWREDKWTKGWIKEWGDVIVKVLAFGFLFYIGKTVTDMLRGPPVTKGQIREAEEAPWYKNPPWWLTPAFGFFESFSIVNEFFYKIHENANSVPGIYNASFAALGKAVEEVMRAFRQKDALGELSDEEKAYLIERVGSGASVLTMGIPGAPVSRGLAGYYRYKHELQVPEGFWDWIRLLQRGQTEPQRPRPRERGGGRPF